MRILGIDYGEKRIGLAVSDELGMLARELKIVSPKEFWQDLEQLVKEYGIERIILGWPLNMSGVETKKTHEVRSFKLQLEKAVTIPVELMDERLSSQMAENLPGGKTQIDSLAAQIILQNYLNKNSSQ